MKHLKIYEKFIKESKENPNQIELSSNLLRICNVGMYESELSPDNLFDMELNNDDEDKMSEEELDNFHTNFDMDKYKKMILKNVEEYLTELDILGTLKSINPHIKEIKYEEIWSPKYYNYGTDELYFDLIVDEDFYKYILDDINVNIYDSHLGDTNKSYPGFSSLMPKTTEELKFGIEDKDERAVAAWLEMKLYETDYEWDEEDFIEHLKQDYKHPLDFVTTNK